VGAQLPAIRAFKNLYGFTPLRTIYEMLGMPTHRQFTPKAFLNIDHLPGVAPPHHLA